MLLARISTRNRSSVLSLTGVIAGRIPDLSTKHLALKSAFIMGEPPQRTQDAQIQPSQQEENGVEGGPKDEESRKEEVKTTTPPPPPEKPLAGDCCGSGCVRCVWDVYYEELEEYNKLHG